MKTIRVHTGNHSYPILVGNGLGSELAKRGTRLTSEGRLFVFYDANLYALHATQIRKNLGRVGNRRREFVVPSGERAKSTSVLAGIHDFLLSEESRRGDFILACGGGVTSDLVGYAAATVLRGVRWGVLTTTLLGMVDASIGGKTGINHRRGKNLIGAFHQPELVMADLDFLTTLPERQLIAGLGEVLKTAGLSGRAAITMLDRYLDRGDLYNPKLLARLVHLCADYKAGVVEKDERESGARMVLNLGHTFAHGIEHTLGYGRLLHGEAVILGVYAALELGERLGFGSSGLNDYRESVARLMRCVPRRRMEAGSIVHAMVLDKKHSTADQRYVILKRPGRPVILEGVDRRTVRAAVTAMLKRYSSGRGSR